MASSLPSSSSSPLWTEQQQKKQQQLQQPVPQPAPVDPYKELELYLEKAHEEIGAVFQQLEVSSRLRSETAASQALPKLKQPPPVPVRRHVPTPLFNLNQQVINHNINHIHNNNNNNNLINNWNKAAKVVPSEFATADVVGSGGGSSSSSSSNGSKKRPGLRVTEEYFIGDLELASSRKHHWNSRDREVSGNGGGSGKQLVAVDRTWNGSGSSNAAVQRRISCPGLSSAPSSSPTSSTGLMMTTSSSFLTASDKCDADAATAAAAAAATTTSATSDRSKKKNPRRQLRRYLTADSALQLTDNGRLLPPSASMSYQPQAIQLWTSSLMAEFNHIIDGEIQRLEGVAASSPSSSATPSSSARTVHQRRLSPWARTQMKRIDPALASSATVPLRTSSSSNSVASTANATRSNSATDIKKLTADIDLVERQILDDLDHITLTLNSQQQQQQQQLLKKQTTTASTMTNTTTVVQVQPSKHKLDGASSSSSSPLLIPPPAKPLSSPLLRSHELQDFLRRVEDSIRTGPAGEGIPPRPPPPSDDVDVVLTTSKLMPETILRDQVESPDAGVATASGSEVSNDDGMSPLPCQHQVPRSGTPTFDRDAGTQTSPMSLSRSSSFLWVSDCNCSGSLENAAVTTSAASLRRQSAASSQSGVSRIVHMDTSMSSLVSDPLRTPDSAADEDEDNRSSSVSSIAHSLDDGRLDLELDHHLGDVVSRRQVGEDVGGGAESGIGTGSPPPRDRRRRPLPPPPPQTELMSPSDRNLSGEEENDSLDDEQVTFTTSSSSSSSSSSNSSSSSTSSDEAAKRKRREKVRRRETWEKIRRRHSCKRVNSRPRAAQNTTKPEVVWIRRGAESPPPPPVPPHATPLPSAVAAASSTILSLPKVPPPVPEDEPSIQQHPPAVATLQQQSAAQTQEPVLHKPPVVVVVQSPVPRPKPRPLIFHTNESAVPTAASVKAALQSSLAMELNASAKSPYPSSSSNNGGGSFLRVGTKHLKPISASSTPTEPHMTLEIGLAAARSHSESAFAELEATEACRWLRATGFPQYAQMYEDWQFPLDLNVVERDHPFLDVDSLQALFRRLATLNRMARLRSEKARSRPQGDESDEEDQECALSDQWTFQRHSRRWSRIVDLPDGDHSGLLELEAAAVAAAAEDAHDGKRPITEDGQDAGAGGGDQTADPVILGSFRRSSSERLRHGAKSLLRRMESLRSKNKRRPVAPSARSEGGGLLISGPQLLDASGMEDRMKELNCVDLSPPDSANMSSSTPSPDLNRIKNESPSPVAVHAPVAASSSAAINTSIEPLATPSPTPSPAGSVKTKSGKSFFGRRPFRPSVGSTTSTAGSEDQKDGAHSDSECSPSYWRRSPSATPKDANSNDTTAAAWNMFAATGDGSSPTPNVVRSHQSSQSLRWKSSKKSRDQQLDSVFTGPSTGSGDLSTTPSPRGKLYLNFNSSSKSKTKQRSSNTASPEDEDTMHSASTPIASSRYHAETTAVGTPSGSLLMETTFGIVSQHDSGSTGTGTSGGSHIDSDYSPATARAPLVVRWHSFRRSSSSSSITFNNQSIAIASLTVGQYAMLRKLALLRLTALLERNTASSKPSWGWDLPKFMRKTKVPDYKDKSMFGVPLSVMMQRTGEALPRPLLAALHYLRQSALDHIGLFRKSGVRSRITKLKELCEAWSLAAANGCDDDPQQPAPIDFGEHQSYDVADMVKQYFRELPEALMTNKLSETFVTIFQVVPVPQRLEALRCTMLLLPDEHREALQTFLGFLTDVAALASVNQMTPSNLAVCLAPSLFHLPATSSSNRAGPVGVNISGNNNNASISSSGGVNNSSPRRRKTVGVPDQRELSQNKAAHECLLQMINDYRNLFTVPEDIFRQCRCTYLDDSIPVTLDDLHTVEFGDWQAYMNGCMAALLKETKDRSRGWEAMSNDLRVDMAWKKVGDGHALRLWRISVDVEGPPSELMNRVLRERHLWDASLVKFRTVVRLDKKSDVVHYTTATEVPVCTRDFTVLRSWRNDLPRGTCLIAETSIEHADAPVPSQSAGVIRGIVLASRYLIQPCGAGKSRLIHLARVDVKGRSPDWYNKHYGYIGAMQVARLRDSFCHLVADGPESKV